jgi:hypothetical protein
VKEQNRCFALFGFYPLQTTFVAAVKMCGGGGD